MENLRLTQFYRVLHRPNQIMGGERELMLFSMLVVGSLIVSAMNFVAAIIGILIWFISIYGLRKMAKADPNMSKIYLRQLKYANYYAPFSRPFRLAKSRYIY